MYPTQSILEGSYSYSLAIAKAVKDRLRLTMRNPLAYGLALSLVFQLIPTLALASNLSALNKGLVSTYVDPATKNASLVFGLLLGVMVTGSAYLFFIWIMMREKAQLFLVSLLVCLSIYIVNTNDMIMDQVGFPLNIRYLLACYSTMASCLFSLCFTYYFLELDINNPKLGIPLIIVGILLALLLFYSPFDPNQNIAQFLLPTVDTVCISVILVIGLICFYQNIIGSLTHITAFATFMGGIVADSFYDLGYITQAGMAHNITYVSFSMAALLFAIVIASQFAARQEEKEKALAISNERFTLVTRGSNEGLFDWDLTTGEVFYSDQLRKILGLRLDNATEGLKQWIRMIFLPDRRIVRDALRRFRHNPDINTINVEYRVILSNSHRRWLHTKAVAVRDVQQKRILRLVGSTNDVTARKQSEVALRASEARFRSITEAHPVPVMIVNLMDMRILYASPGAEQLLELRQEQLLNEHFDRFLSDSDVRSDIWQSMSEGREVNLKEVTLDRGDGRKLEAALSARRISYQGDESMVIGLYDLTERKQAEAQISRQQEALQQSEKMAALGSLLAGVAHELNNPLSVVVGQTTLLMEGSTDSKVVTRAEKIFKAADRCTRIVKSFLALARRKAPERKPVNVNAVISAALELLGYQIRTWNILVNMDLDEKLAEITGDSDQLTQVITNLVMNAAQAMETWNGPRRINIISRHDDHQVTVQISDTGPGVPLEIRTRIFEPFFTTKAGKGGTGIGLSLCLNIIASHGGQMTLEDTPGGGATFLITLPIAESSQTSNSISQQDTVALPEHIRFLLVDDEVEIAQTLADLLEPEGHQVDIAANGAIALDKLKKNTYDVIISDLRMPVLDGPGLYDALGRELPSYLNKIIYVTGDTLSTNVQTFLSQYPVPVVEKPYRLNDIRLAVVNLLNENGSKKPQQASGA